MRLNTREINSLMLDDVLDGVEGSNTVTLSCGVCKCTFENHIDPRYIVINTPCEKHIADFRKLDDRLRVRKVNPQTMTAEELLAVHETVEVESPPPTLGVSVGESTQVKDKAG